MRYRSFHERLIRAVTTTPGAVPESLRRAVLERAEQPEALRHYVETVARHAYKVTDGDITGLKHAGYSDDAIFEITVSAAVGAAMHRLERGMAALRGEEPD